MSRLLTGVYLDRHPARKPGRRTCVVAWIGLIANASRTAPDFTFEIAYGVVNWILTIISTESAERSVIGIRSRQVIFTQPQSQQERTHCVTKSAGGVHARSIAAYIFYFAHKLQKREGRQGHLSLASPAMPPCNCGISGRIVNYDNYSYQIRKRI